MYKRLISIFLLFSVFSCPTVSHGQNDAKSLYSPRQAYERQSIPQQSFDENAWREITSSVNYFESPTDKKEREVPSRADQDGTAQGDAEQAPNRGAAAGTISKTLSLILRGIAIAAIVVLLALLVRIILLNSNVIKNKKVDLSAGSAEIARIEEDLEQAELADPISRAIANEDYPLALRLYYLACLQSLALNKWLQWKKEKTNWEYQRELSGTPFSEDFSRLTAVFDQVWYGGFPLGKARFVEVQGRIESFLSRVDSAKRQNRTA